MIGIIVIGGNKNMDIGQNTLWKQNNFEGRPTVKHEHPTTTIWDMRTNKLINYYEMYWLCVTDTVAWRPVCTIHTLSHYYMYDMSEVDDNVFQGCIVQKYAWYMPDS